MSVQFGRWSFDGEPPEPDYLEKAAGMLAPYGPDGGGAYSAPGIDILYRAFHTTKESRREQQPLATPSGSVITWDGRLDNREELVEALGGALSAESTDLEIVAAAHDKWKTDCFARLIGDWAVSIWNPQDRSLILASDFVGTRHIYYVIENDKTSWCSVLDPLVYLAIKPFQFEREYAAGWLCFTPAVHLTPYSGLHSVCPSTFVRITPQSLTTQKFWGFDPYKKLAYRSDGEYEEHFRAAFTESVRRRLRSDAPVLAELSGGLDSSSIVSLADRLIEQRIAETPRLDTVSYFDDSEPCWDERPYFSLVERLRSRQGLHIDFGPEDPLRQTPETNWPEPLPAACHFTKGREEFQEFLAANKSRVLLSGIGGDEITGGNPNPLPELADLLRTLQIRKFASQLKIWAIHQKRPWFHIFTATVRSMLASGLGSVPMHSKPPKWLCPHFMRSYRTALAGYRHRASLFGPLPSFQERILTLEALRRQLGCSTSLREALCEVRYPFLDRGLLEFLFAIPPNQLIRPGQRRSLMRRSLTGVVPDEILHRRRKAYISRKSRTTLAKHANELSARLPFMSLARFGIIEPAGLAASLEAVQRGSGDGIVHLVRAFLLEGWLQEAIHRGVLAAPPSAREEYQESAASHASRLRESLS